MSLSAIVLVATAVTLSLYAWVIFRGLMQQDAQAAQAWGEWAAALESRHEIILSLMSRWEQLPDPAPSTWRALTQLSATALHAGAAGDVAAAGVAESQLRGHLSRLLAALPAVNELRSHERLLDRWQQLQAVHVALGRLREQYNACAAGLNARRAQIPDVLVARATAIAPRMLLQLDTSRNGDANLQTQFAG